MRKLVALLAILGFATQAYANGADLSWNGEFRLQYFNDMNADLDEDAPDSPNQAWMQRTRLGGAVRAGEKLSANFMLVHNSYWGANGLDGQFPGGQDNDGTLGLDNNSVNNMLIVNEAYMNWMINDATMLRAGRGSFTMGDGLVVSANDWQPVSKAFDGALLTYDHEVARFGLFGVMGLDHNNVGIGSGFNEFGRFYGVTADFKSLPDFLKTAHVHYMVIKVDPIGTTAAEDTTRIGVTVAGDSNGVDYKATYAMYDGDNDDGGGTGTQTGVSSTMMDVVVGYSMPETMGLRVHAGYHTDSGDSDPAAGDLERYAGFHYDTHNNAGLMDIFGFGNLTYWRVGASVMPSDDVTVGIEYFQFTQTEKEDGNNYIGSVLAPAGDANEDDLGTEIDLVVTKKYNNNFSTQLRYGIFQPGDEFGSDADDYSQVYLEAKLTF